MKLILEMTEEEYQMFKDYKDNRTPYNKLKYEYDELLNREDKLQDIIRKMLPEYNLWATSAPLYYYLEKKENKDE